MECIECNGKVEKKEIDYIYKGINFGKFEAEVCTKCNATYFKKKSVQKIQKKAKELGVWGKGKCKKESSTRITK